MFMNKNQWSGKCVNATKFSWKTRGPIRTYFIIFLYRVPRSWTGSVQMKSSMTFIRGNRCIEREKDNFKSCEVIIKRLKECALALR